MKLTQYAVLARKFHRILLFFSVPLGLAQMITGAALLYPTLFPFLPIDMSLSVHIATAPWFAAVLFLAMLTGLYLYLYPYLRQWLRKSPQT